MSFLDDKVFVQREKKGRERGMEGWRDGGREREIGREREEGMKERKTERQGMREREEEDFRRRTDTARQRGIL